MSLLMGLLTSLAILGLGADEPPARPMSLEDRRLELMTGRVQKITITDADGAHTLSTTPLYRYDDPTRGYVDGTVWKWGAAGRPGAIVTAELHPDYLNGGPRIVYDLLSLSDAPFSMKSPDLIWSPRGSAVTMTNLPNAPEVANTPAQRLTQLKQLARRFSGVQAIKEQTASETSVSLRLITREIDRYKPADHTHADGAIFLFANGRNPSIVLLIETDGTNWSWGAGRLSLPSTLELKLDGTQVWTVPAQIYPPGSAYSATNSAIEIPKS
jgi:hypothetical protein